jgi:hypothetical protein
MSVYNGRGKGSCHQIVNPGIVCHSFNKVLPEILGCKKAEQVVYIVHISYLYCALDLGVGGV